MVPPHHSSSSDAACFGRRQSPPSSSEAAADTQVAPRRACDGGRAVDEQREGMRAQRIGFARFPDPPGFGAAGRLGGIDQRLPDERRRQFREMKVEIAVIGVHHHQKALVDVALSARRIEFAGGAAQHIAERLADRVAPILAGRLDPGRRDPGNVLQTGLRQHLAAEEARPREHPVLAAGSGSGSARSRASAASSGRMFSQSSQEISLSWQ